MVFKDCIQKCKGVYEGHFLGFVRPIQGPFTSSMRVLGVVRVLWDL